MDTIQQVVIAVRSGCEARRTEFLETTGDVCSIDLHELISWFTEDDPGSVLQTERKTLFFHPLPSGNFTIGRLIPGNKGVFYVHYCIITPRTFLFYGNNPFPLYRDILRNVNTPREESFCNITERFRLKAIGSIGNFKKSPIFNSRVISNLLAIHGVEPIALLVQSFLDSVCTVCSGNRYSLEMIEGLFNLVPVMWRPELSFASDLIFSSQRPFRIIGVPVASLVNIRELESRGASCRSLVDRDIYRHPAIGELDPWAKFIYYMLLNEELDLLGKSIRKLGNSSLSFLGELSELNILGLKYLRKLFTVLSIDKSNEISEYEDSPVSFPLPWVRNGSSFEEAVSEQSEDSFLTLPINVPVIPFRVR